MLQPCLRNPVSLLSTCGCCPVERVWLHPTHFCVSPGQGGPGPGDAAFCSIVRGHWCYCTSQEQASWKERSLLPSRWPSSCCLWLNPAGVKTREQTSPEGEKQMVIVVNSV